MPRMDIPEQIKSFYFDFHWSQKKLWALSLSVDSMPVSDFDWLLDFPIWATDPPRLIFDLCPRDVMKRPDLFLSHQKRIECADCSFPIHIMNWKGRWVILDGFHRLVRLLMEKKSHVNVLKVPISLIPAIAPDRERLSGFAKYECDHRL